MTGQITKVSESQCKIQFLLTMGSNKFQWPEEGSAKQRQERIWVQNYYVLCIVDVPTLVDSRNVCISNKDFKQCNSLFKKL
jgi:hypothetical protein